MTRSLFLSATGTATVTALAGLLALPFSTAAAQQSEERTQPTQQCLLELNTMAERMQEDQFWLTGWGGGYGPPAPQSTRAPAATSPSNPPATDMTNGATVSSAADPRGEAQGIYSPRHQIRALQRRARPRSSGRGRRLRLRRSATIRHL